MLQAHSGCLLPQAELHAMRRHFKEQAEQIDRMGRQISTLRGSHSIDLQQRRCGTAAEEEAATRPCIISESCRSSLYSARGCG